MNIHYQKLNTNRQWKAATGVSQKHFEILVPLFADAFVQLFGKSMQDRQNDGTTEACLKTPADLLFFLLFYLKNGLTLDVLGFVFGMNGSNAQRNIDIATRALRAALTPLGVMPKREFKDVAEFEEYFKEHKSLILDGTEQRMQRPENQAEQKACYSGKKKVTL
ncbi:MAG: transposase family protein [Bacteroidetes bacterium]|nr:transposase family protein [Bacteroidota bacterium]